MPSPPDWLKDTYRYNETAGRYIDSRGRFVSGDTVRASLDNVLDGLATRAQVTSEGLRTGVTSLAEWQRDMMGIIKDTHLTAAAAYKGGWAQMTQADYGWAGQIIREEYAYLRDFAESIADGSQKLDGTLRRRAALYEQQGRPTYYKFAQADLRGRGYDLERSILNPAEHCDLCISEAARGFVPIGELIPIGQRTCRSNDRCSMEYRNSATEETRSL